MKLIVLETHRKSTDFLPFCRFLFQWLKIYQFLFCEEKGNVCQENSSGTEVITK